jgi:hypothetical protein
MRAPCHNDQQPKIDFSAGMRAALFRRGRWNGFGLELLWGE